MTTEIQKLINIDFDFEQSVQNAMTFTNDCVFVRYGLKRALYRGDLAGMYYSWVEDNPVSHSKLPFYIEHVYWAAKNSHDLRLQKSRDLDIIRIGQSVIRVMRRELDEGDWDGETTLKKEDMIKEIQTDIGKLSKKL